jgi:hypothetical protein
MQNIFSRQDIADKLFITKPAENTLQYVFEKNYIQTNPQKLQNIIIWDRRCNLTSFILQVRS